MGPVKLGEVLLDLFSLVSARVPSRCFENLLFRVGRFILLGLRRRFAELPELGVDAVEEGARLE